MTITPEQIILATPSVYRGSKPVDDGGCEYVLSFMVPTRREAEAIEAYVNANDGRAALDLIAMCSDDAMPPPAARGPYATFAQALRETGWLARAEVLDALGCDDDYHAWVSYQPSIVSGAYSETDESGDDRNVSCHVRRAGDGGTGYKPPFCQVPMTHDEHHRQHAAGELAVYIRWQRLQGIAPLSMSRDDAMRWFDQAVAEHRTRWAELQLCRVLGAARLGDIQPITVIGWAREQGVPLPGTSAHEDADYETQ